MKLMIQNGVPWKKLIERKIILLSRRQKDERRIRIKTTTLRNKCAKQEQKKKEANRQEELHAEDKAKPDVNENKRKQK